jgi:hypothetical protein
MTNQNTNPSSYLDSLDLNLDNYELNDIFHLFGITENHLTDEIMKDTRKIVLKIHPDKSKLDPKFYLFFEKAYKRLIDVYTFQNKSEAIKKKQSTVYDGDFNNDNNDIASREKNALLDHYFQKNGGFSNQTFNEWFDKNKIEDENTNGYGDWLKTDEGVYHPDDQTEKINKGNLNAVFEKQKKAMKSVVVYKGVADDIYLGSGIGGTLLNITEDNQNYTPTDVFSKGGLIYTDIKQAHVETVIPVTEEDYESMPKFKNVNEYQNYRSSQKYKVETKAEAEQRLRELERKKDGESASLAYYYAKQSEKVKEKDSQFWGQLKKITNY